MPLPGGWQTTVRRDGDIVRRQARPSSASVLDLLDYLESQQFDGSPRRVGSGFDLDGNETLTFVAGQSPQPSPWSDAGITALGDMVAQLHQAARSYEPSPDAIWHDCLGRQLGDPSAGFGHGDLGPWNIMAIKGLPVGFIDWDTAGPIDPIWELAHVAWLNAQLHDDDVAQVAGLGAPAHRAHQLGLLVDAYGLSQHDRIGFVDKMVALAIHDAAAQAKEHSIGPDTTNGVDDTGYPFAWGLAWRTRAASWMLRNRSLLEAAIGC